MAEGTLTDVARPPTGSRGQPPAGRTPLVVASVPAGHVYVRHLGPLEASYDAARRLPDPHPDRPGELAGERWWPPRMLDPEWVRRHDVGLMHLHFGYDDRSPAQLGQLVAALRERSVPLVLTVHDLRNPHHDDPEELGRQLDVLLPAAAAVVTLTDGAARALRDRWGVSARVLPHPHVVELPDIPGYRRTSRAAGARPRIGLSAKSLRRNTDPLRLLPALISVAAAGTAEVVVDVHRDVYDEPPTAYAARLRRELDDAAAAGRLELWVHDRLDDDQLWRHLAGLDAVVLPYRFGTHSGWLEAAHDLGVRVVAPSFGHYADQGTPHDPVHVYAADETSVDLDALVAAMRAAVRAHRIEPATTYVDRRRAQRHELAAAHEAVYRRAVEEAR